MPDGSRVIRRGPPFRRPWLSEGLIHCRSNCRANGSRKGWCKNTSRDRGGVVLSSVRQIAAGLRETWEKEVVTQTKSQEPADREKEEGSASDGQAEDDEETEDNVHWATSKAMDALKPDKIVVHLTALAGPGVTGVQHGSHGLLCPAR